MLDYPNCLTIIYKHYLQERVNTKHYAAFYQIEVKEVDFSYFRKVIAVIMCSAFTCYLFLQNQQMWLKDRQRSRLSY
jgi:hypothetical protein